MAISYNKTVQRENICRVVSVVYMFLLLVQVLLKIFPFRLVRGNIGIASLIGLVLFQTLQKRYHAI